MIFWAGATGFACEQNDGVLQCAGCGVGHGTEEGGLMMNPEPLYWYEPFPENTHLFLFGQRSIAPFCIFIYLEFLVFI